MATKLTQYIMSEKFQEVCARAGEKAVEKARAAGLRPAGDQVPVPPSKPSITVVVSPCKPRSKG